jgi:hypothetical protein
MKETPERSVGHDDVRFGESLSKLFNRHVGRLLNRQQNRRRMGFCLLRTTVAAHRLWRRVTLCALQRSPSAYAGGAHAKATAHPSSRCSIGHGRKHTGAKIHRQGFVPPASNPAGSLNHSIADSGIPIPIQSFRIAP